MASFPALEALGSAGWAFQGFPPVPPLVLPSPAGGLRQVELPGIPRGCKSMENPWGYSWYSLNSIVHRKRILDHAGSAQNFMEFIPVWDLFVHFPPSSSQRSLGPRSALIPDFPVEIHWLFPWGPFSMEAAGSLGWSIPRLSLLSFHHLLVALAQVELPGILTRGCNSMENPWGIPDIPLIVHWKRTLGHGASPQNFLEFIPV